MSEVRINLIPPEIAARRRARRRRGLCLLGGAVVLAVFLGVYGALFAAAAHSRAEAARLRAEREGLERQAAAYEQYANLRAEATRAEGLLRQVVGAPPDWARTLAGIGLYIPANVWLTDFAATCKPAEGKKTAPSAPPAAPAAGAEGQGATPASSPPPPGGELTVRGWTFDHPSVARWLEEIRSVPGLTDVRCQFSSEDDLYGQPMVQFEIKATLLPGPAFRPAAGKAGE
ncbi:MAG: PilN domain-containing protein [Thermoanaerobacterales bacterium]|nr:PilN domain-containing protein [Thermoanaerobacterales bacterium]